MPKSGVLTFLFLFSVLALGACDKGPKDGQVATINGEAISTEEYRNILAARFGTKVARNSAERTQAIDFLIKRKLLIQEAQHQQLDKNDNVAQAIKLSREELLIHALTSKYFQDNPVTEQDAKKRYNELTKENQYKVSHILLPSEEKAIQFIADLKKGKSFKSIASKHSLDIDSAKRGGRIGWVSPNGLAPQIYIAAAGLKQGKISTAPVKSDFGWHIVRRDGSRKNKLPPFKIYKQKMMEQVHRERIDTLLKHLRSKATVIVSEK